MTGMSVLKYFKSLFSEIAKGRTDYENMLPMTISLFKATKKTIKSIMPMRTESNLFELCRMQPILNNH